MIKPLLIAAIALGVQWNSDARASEWGCKVLLCASAENPGWQAYPDCHPPMYKLIACRAKMFNPCGWPACPEAGTGDPGYQEFDACPDGYTPAVNPNTSDQGQIKASSTALDACSRTVANPNCQAGSSNCEQTITEYIPRPRKADPFYFDIKSEESEAIERHWFNLNK
jgi:hypothetical protein